MRQSNLDRNHSQHNMPHPKLRSKRLNKIDADAGHASLPDIAMKQDYSRAPGTMGEGTIRAGAARR
jgi:hypothetical protein